MPSESDLAYLILRSAERDMTAFQALYQQTAPLMLRIALDILGRRDLAEEAVQDAYLQIWSRAASFSPARGSARGWMAVIQRRRAIDRLRASPWLHREAPEAEMIESRIASLPASLELRQCLDRLSPQVRHGICLAYLYGMTHMELSTATGTPLGTLKSRLRRGLAALKECLEQ